LGILVFTLVVGSIFVMSLNYNALTHGAEDNENNICFNNITDEPEYSDQFFKDAVLGHGGLFVLFSRKCGAIFLLRNACIISSVLTSSLAKGGWAWSVEDALALYGTYTMSVYFFHWRVLADRYLGYRWAVILGRWQ
jgi:hypothetical protein